MPQFAFIHIRQLRRLLLLFALTIPGCAAGGSEPPLHLHEGSGFFAGADGLAVTDTHVVAQCDRIELRSAFLPPVSAILVAEEPALDLALLRAPVEAPATLALSEQQSAGALFVLGYPGGSAGGSARHAPARRLSAHGSLIWLDAPAIGPGWSGAPVLDADAHVAGVIRATMDGNEPGVALATALAGRRFMLPPPRPAKPADAARAIVQVLCVSAVRTPS